MNDFEWIEQVKKGQAERRILEVKLLCDPTVPNSIWVSITDDIRYYNRYIQYLENDGRFK